MVQIKLDRGGPASSKAVIDGALTRAVLAMIIAAYSGDRHVEVPVSQPRVPVAELQEFFQFILRYPPSVPVPTVAVREVRSSSPVARSTALANLDITLASGGMDSTAALLLSQEAGRETTALWCDYGQPYAAAELEAVTEVCKRLEVRLLRAFVDLGPFMRETVIPFNHIVPARNFLLVALCADGGAARVALSGLLDELEVPDKSPRMFREASRIAGIELAAPLIRYTKADIARVWMAKWNERVPLESIVSCYSSDGQCENCSACAKREVGLVAAGYHVELPAVFVNQQDLIFESWLPRLNTFVPERRADLLLALAPFADRFKKWQQPLGVALELYADECHRRAKALRCRVAF